MATAAGAAAALLLAACGGPSLPDSVTSGSSVKVGWSHTLTTMNTAGVEVSAGDREIDALTHRRFAEVVEGKVQTDPGFGTVTILKQKPFTVRYDLAEPTWSDGVGVDATDLLLAWAAGTNPKAGFTVGQDDLARGVKVVRYDESARALEVTFETPEPEWQTALQVSVPAHVVGQQAFGVEDPMEAKKRVADVILGQDSRQLPALAKVWNTGFDVQQGTPEASLRLANGPYQVEKVTQTSAKQQQVVLRVNPRYVGSHAPSYERIILTQGPVAGRLESLGHGNDVVVLDPDPKQRLAVRNLERREYQLSTASDGTQWMVVVRATSPTLGAEDAPRFLKTLAREAITQGGAQGWADAYTASDSYLFDPGSSDYSIAVEDSRIKTVLGKPKQEPAGRGRNTKEPPPTSVCVGYDSTNAFATRAYQALVPAMKEEGWALRSCGAPGVNSVADHPQADAVLIRVPISDDPDVVNQQWGGDESLPGLIDSDREPLLATYRSATERFAARDARVAIERSIVDQEVAMPVATNPHVVLSVPQVSGVSMRSGPTAPLLSGAAEWSPTR